MLPEGQKMVTRKQPISMRARNCSGKFFGSVALRLVVACLLMFSSRLKNKSETNKAHAGGSILNDPLALVLTPQSGDSRTDREISRLQQKIRDGRNLQLLLEQLGWAFVAKAREISTQVFTNWLSSARNASKSAIRKARRRCYCAGTCCRICIASKNPRRWRVASCTSEDSALITGFWAMR